MKKLAIAMLAAGALATSFAPAASAAAPDPLTDSGCGFTSVTDPNPEAPDFTQTGYLHGGPIAQNGTITCTIKVGVNTHAGAYVNGASASATGTSGVTVLAPTIVSYVSPSGVPVFACDQFNDGSTTWVLDARTDTWVAAGTPGAECYLAISGGTDDPVFDPIFDLLDTIDALLVSLEKDVIDPLVCPVLQQLQGDYAGLVTINSQGDVFIAGEPFWDCPPYDLFS